MNIREITKQWLEQHGYDGLYQINDWCACRLNDLMPCDEINPFGCEPGYEAPCDCEDECEFHIVKEKPKKSKG